MFHTFFIINWFSKTPKSLEPRSRGCLEIMLPSTKEKYTRFILEMRGRTWAGCQWAAGVTNRLAGNDTHVVPGHRRVELTWLNKALPVTTTFGAVCECVCVGSQNQQLAAVPSPHYFHLVPLQENLESSDAISNSQDNQQITCWYLIGAKLLLDAGKLEMRWMIWRHAVHTAAVWGLKLSG